VHEKRRKLMRAWRGATNEFDRSYRLRLLTIGRRDLNVKVFAQPPVPERVEKYADAAVRNLE
jgi:hypothetical protein